MKGEDSESFKYREENERHQRVVLFPGWGMVRTVLVSLPPPPPIKLYILLRGQGTAFDQDMMAS